MSWGARITRALSPLFWMLVVTLPLLGTVEAHHGVLPVPINYGGPVLFGIARLQQLLGMTEHARSDRPFGVVVAVKVR